MGCGIHVYTERKLKNIEGKEEEWINIDNWRLNKYYGIDAFEPQYVIKSLYDHRDYRLFSVLANVRNYSNNKYICEPRGLPADVTDVVKKESDNYGVDGHSHSYFTLAELKAFRKENNITKYSGYVSPEGSRLIDLGEMPNAWCQGTNVKTPVYRTWEREESPLDPIIEALEKRMKEEFWIFDDKEHPEKEDYIRIVFWFDN